jgi:DNA-binding CsgD family transcriptional regulator
VLVKLIRTNDGPHHEEPRQLAASGLGHAPGTYFFYETNTGVSHFQVKAAAGGLFPVGEAAGLLAMHCIVRDQSPHDYVVLIEAAHDVLEGLAEKAGKLLQAGHSVGNSVKLTRREGEVLDAVMNSLANKEIAASLHLAVRTIKFHVSSLLTKFRVRGRMELVREATRLKSTMPVPQSSTKREARGATPIPATRHSAPRVGPIAMAKRHLMV